MASPILFKTILSNSGLGQFARIVNDSTIVCDIDDTSLHIIISNGEQVCESNFSEQQVKDMQVKLSLAGVDGVLALIKKALTDLSLPSSELYPTTGLHLTLARASRSELRVSLPLAANSSAALRRVLKLLAQRSLSLAKDLTECKAALEKAKSRSVEFSESALGVAGRQQLKRKMPTTALPGMSLINPMQRRRKAPTGVVFDNDSDSDD